MQYVFDTNIFITLQRKQPMDTYPIVWEKMGQLMEDGIVISSREVYDEIIPGKDTLAEWVKQRKEYFLPTTTYIQQLTRDILYKHRGLVEGGKKANSADPFVIALARQKNATVVTEEGKNGSLSAPQIPDVCEKEQIDCIDFITFLRRNAVSFR